MVISFFNVNDQSIRFWLLGGKLKLEYSLEPGQVINYLFGSGYG